MRPPRASPCHGKVPRAWLAEPWHAHLATLTASAPKTSRPRWLPRGCSPTICAPAATTLRHEPVAARPLPDAGNLAGSPALTFAPLGLPADSTAPDGSLWAMMRRRYEAYKDVVVRPFFRDHFSRLDRQVVLVDALSAFNSGPEALHDLEAALAGILDCFRIGRSTLLSSLFRPRDRPDPVRRDQGRSPAPFQS